MKRSLSQDSDDCYIIESQSSEPIQFDEDDGLDFEEPFPFDETKLKASPESKIIYKTSYRCLDSQQLLDMQAKIIEDVSVVLQIPLDLCRALLRAYRWDRDCVIEKYTDSPENTYKLAGIANLMDSSLKPVFSKKRKFTCAICCSDSAGHGTLKLQCGDEFCMSCHKTFFKQQISEGIPKIFCPGACGTLVQDEVLQKVVTRKFSIKFEEFQINYFVEHKKNLKWCPAPNCIFAVECDLSSSLTPIIPSVFCPSRHGFCFNCNLEEHMPCLCKIAKLWLKKCEDDSETSNWIVSNTKDCPGCSTSIEKNGGCNHMHCRKCHFRFCWVCMKSLATHRGGCSLYEAPEENISKKIESRLSLERYVHYYTRYNNHIQSSKLDQKLFSQTEEKMEDLQKSSLISWIEVQFLKDAAYTLVLCRSALKWTYALAFYLEVGNQKSMFEDNQQDLEHATEELSGLLEQKFDSENLPPLKQKVQDKASYVSQRRDILLKFIIQSYNEEAWDYTVDI